MIEKQRGTPSGIRTHSSSTSTPINIVPPLVVEFPDNVGLTRKHHRFRLTMAPELSEKPEKASPEILPSRPSTRGGSTTSTISPPSATEEKSVAQPSKDLTKLDSKAVVAPELNDDPFHHLPEDEAEILRRRKCYLQYTIHYARRGENYSSNGVQYLSPTLYWRFLYVYDKDSILTYFL